MKCGLCGSEMELDSIEGISYGETWVYICSNENCNASYSESENGQVECDW